MTYRPDDWYEFAEPHESGGETIVRLQAKQAVVFRARSERRTMVGVQGDAPTELSSRPGTGTWSVTSGEDPVRVP